MIMVSIDREHETIQYVNAGHNPALSDRRTARSTRSSRTACRSASSPDTRYITQTRAFPAGSCVVLYSDGITEAEDMGGEEFGNERLEALLEQHLDCSAALIRDQIADAVDAFVGEAPQKDDETLVIVRRAYEPRLGPLRRRLPRTFVKRRFSKNAASPSPRPPIGSTPTDAPLRARAARAGRCARRLRARV